MITGCSSGIGRAAARLLKARGWRVLPTARSEEALAGLRGEGFEAIALDMDDADSVRMAVEAALAACNGELGALINNAGYGQPGALEDLDRKVMRAQFETNVIGLQDLTNRCIPVFRRQGYGRIVNVSSVVGRVALPFMGIYSATKFAVEALSDALRIELNGTGVAVSVVEPGPIETDFSKRSLAEAKEALAESQSPYAELYRKRMARERVGSPMRDRFCLPPEAVAVKLAHALESRRPRRRYCVTWPATFGAWAARFFPDALIDALMLRAVKERYRI